MDFHAPKIVGNFPTIPLNLQCSKMRFLNSTKLEKIIEALKGKENQPSYGK